MPAYRYEFYLLVVNSISHSFAALTREISSWPLEDKIHIHARACNILYLYNHADDSGFGDFPKISDHFPKIFQNSCEGRTNLFEHIPNISELFPKIVEDDRRRFEDVSVIYQQI